jgi:hypothetical protein
LNNKIEILKKIIDKINGNKNLAILKYVTQELHFENEKNYKLKFSNDNLMKDKSYVDLFDNNSDMLPISNVVPPS